MAEDEFKPRMGAVGDDRVNRSPGAYLARLGKMVGVSHGGQPSKSGSKTASAIRYGRGYAAAKILSRRAERSSRLIHPVVVKVAVKRLTPKGLQALKAHLRYIERDGLGREGQAGRLYGAFQVDDQAGQFVQRCQEDAHQFRLTLSPREGEMFEALEPLARGLVDQMERDLEVPLDWLAIDHFDTANPHVHMIVRGRDRQGQPLLIAPSYLKAGLAERLAEAVGRELGPPDEARRLERSRGLERRPIGLDQHLSDEQQSQGYVLATDPVAQTQTLKVRRLRRLERLGLAKRLGQARWQLSADALEVLTTIEAEQTGRALILETLERLGQTRSAAELAVWRSSIPQSPLLVGRIVSLDPPRPDQEGRLIVDGLDGKLWLAPTGQASLDAVSGDLVALRARDCEPRLEDHLAVRIATQFKGRYSPALHRLFEPSASPAAIHQVRDRLEGLAQEAGGLRCLASDHFDLADDFLQQVRAFEQRRSRDHPLQVKRLSTLSLEAQTTIDAATWLDQRLTGQALERVANKGFGAEVIAAQDARLAWLIEQGLAKMTPEGHQLTPNLVEVLRQRELRRFAKTYAQVSGLEYVPSRPGLRVSGRLFSVGGLYSEPTLMVQDAQSFGLAPGRPEHGRYLGQTVLAVYRGAQQDLVIIKSLERGWPGQGGADLGPDLGPV